MCKVFVASLSEATMRWFDKLPLDSINSYSEWCHPFVAKYIHQISTQKTTVSLFRMKIDERDVGRFFRNASKMK